jgi:hypothetical protein
VKGQHVLVGAAALVAMAGCSDSHGKKPNVPEVTISPASATAQNAFIEQLRAIDPGLATKPETAVAKGETICLDIAKNLRWNQIEANAEAKFSVGEKKIDQIMAMTQDVLCGKG